MRCVADHQQAPWACGPLSHMPISPPPSPSGQEFTEVAVLAYECGLNEDDARQQLARLSASDASLLQARLNRIGGGGGWEGLWEGNGAAPARNGELEWQPVGRAAAAAAGDVPGTLPPTK